MKVENGSPAAIAWIQKLKSSGNLADIYDLERVAADQSDHLPLESSDLEGFDEQHGTSYRNHLLAVFIDGEVDVKELTNLYPPLSKHFGSDTYIVFQITVESCLFQPIQGWGHLIGMPLLEEPCLV